MVLELTRIEHQQARRACDLTSWVSFLGTDWLARKMSRAELVDLPACNGSLYV
jgi:hypothetical protein